MISSNKFVTVDMVNFSGRGSFYRDEELGVEIIGLPYGPSEVRIQCFHYFHLHILTYACVIYKVYPSY